MKNNSSLILLLLSVALFYVFTNAQYQETKELSSVAGEYREVLRNVSEIAVLRDNLLVTYESLPQTEIERISKVLPDNGDTVKLALELDSLASRHGISIKGVQIGDPGGESGAIVLPGQSHAFEKASVTLSFVSSYEAFVAFLAELERSLRLMDIRSINFHSTQSGLYDIQLIADTYWLK